MATIHDTTIEPDKLEMLAKWLPEQDWFRPGGGELARAGGFRLDDPAGEVGIELLVVTDDRDAYLVPMAYRGAPLEGAPAGALIGTAVHGVLGARWLYDAAQDPVASEQLARLLSGEAVPQMQHESDTVDDGVAVAPTAGPAVPVLRRVLVPVGPAGEPAPGEAVAGYTAPDGTAQRAVFVADGRN
ncbi:1,4-alpha-glucan branching protein [Kitasatospora sp. NA04385]|uniref:maltokinase N-terminal cap-like domain-containing protein n=1 Tax=Kitasatospora sp. NA04385 TaxID=2742135 RepID=UPI001590E527|nr:1,4-alpha-glucan branching protein [Kitasatospora sp. NA04385]QKW20886.1 1,4-alpha-glucan branching protein [Kitasatospora sp. NA04385]